MLSKLLKNQRGNWNDYKKKSPGVNRHKQGNISFTFRQKFEEALGKWFGKETGFLIHRNAKIFCRKHRRLAGPKNQASLCAIDECASIVMEYDNWAYVLFQDIFSGEMFWWELPKTSQIVNGRLSENWKRSSYFEEGITEYELEGALSDPTTEQKSRNSESFQPICLEKMGEKTKEVSMKLFQGIVSQKIWPFKKM